VRALDLEKNLFVSDREFAGSYLRRLGIKNILFQEEGSVEDVKRGKGGKELVIGFGGGRSLDVAKKLATDEEAELYLIPTSPSQNAIASPRASLWKEGKKESFSCKYPRLIAIPLFLWNNRRLEEAGRMDALASVTAVEDVYLANRVVGEKIEREGEKLALFGVLKAVEGKSKIDLAEGLMAQGFAMEKSSRYCSGAEHELEKLITGKGFLHGEIVGAATLITAHAYSGVNLQLCFSPAELFENMVDIFRRAGVARRSYEVLVSKEFTRALSRMDLQKLREVRRRYTLWKYLRKVNLKKEWEEVEAMLRGLL